MPERAPERIWSIRRQWLGNLAPIGLAIACALTVFRLGIIWQGIVGTVAAWIGVSQLGFFENSKIDRELREKLASDGELIGFVHLRSPTMLDAHAELGLLTISPNQLIIETEDESYVIRRSEILNIVSQMNIHSLICLGGWISLGLDNGTTFKFESRKFNTMIESRKRTKVLLSELKTWINEKAPA